MPVTRTRTRTRFGGGGVKSHIGRQSMRPILCADQSVGQEDASDFIADFASSFTEDEGYIG
jgi:hypothetical protein